MTTESARAPVARSVEEVAAAIAARAEGRSREGPALLVGVSGIDGSGKSHLSGAIAAALAARGLTVAPIGIDPWQNPQTIRFGGADPGRHFYQHVIRFAELFGELVDPLVASRSIRLTTRGIRTDRDVFDEIEYRFDGVEVVLLEGILLFQRSLVGRFDLRVWIECSFETAVRRALARNVEDLPAERLLEDYERIYHAAQRHHFAVDEPQRRADIVLLNEADA